jgi:hypothetical protein
LVSRKAAQYARAPPEVNRHFPKRFPVIGKQATEHFQSLEFVRKLPIFVAAANVVPT